MFKPTALLTIFLAALLGACGGDGSGSVVGDSTTDTTSGEDTSVDSGTDTVSTDTTVSNPQIGTGTGSSYLDGQLNISTATLSAGGSTQITATIVDAGNNNAKIVTDEYYVVFSSDCASQSPALSEFSKTDATVTNGSVSVTYNAKGCVGTDLVTISIFASSSGVASLDQVLSIATGTVDVAQAEIGAITYVGTDAPAISISTIGDAVLPKLATLTFKVVDKSNNPVANKDVSFELTNTTGGVDLALDESVTNENGEVTAVLVSGTTHAVTSVRATTLATDGVTEITTSSQPISITTGLADQDSFDISFSVFNPGAYGVNNVEVDVTANVADQFNNPVADGTIVSFTAESGQIPGYCATSGGTCTVKWSSGGDKPGEQNSSLERVNELDPIPSNNIKGMTTITAYSLGEASFTDANGNGVYDIGEPFASYPEVFRDDNYNDTVDVGTSSNPVEFFEDLNANGVYDAAPSVYQGVLCSDEAKAAGHCASLMNVRDSGRIMQSMPDSVSLKVYTKIGSDYTEVPDPKNNLSLGASGTFYVVFQDDNGNIPAVGSTFATSADGYKLYGRTGSVKKRSVGVIDPADPDILGNGLPSFGDVFVVSYEVDGTPVDITVTAVSGDQTESITFK
jgi:hypothetical protein